MNNLKTATCPKLSLNMGVSLWTGDSKLQTDCHDVMLSRPTNGCWNQFIRSIILAAPNFPLQVRIIHLTEATWLVKTPGGIRQRQHQLNILLSELNLMVSLWNVIWGYHNGTLKGIKYFACANYPKVSKEYHIWVSWAATTQRSTSRNFSKSSLFCVQGCPLGMKGAQMTI